MTTEAKMPKPVRFDCDDADIGVCAGVDCVCLDIEEGGEWTCAALPPATARKIAAALSTMADAVEAAQAQPPIIDADEQGHIDPAAAADVAARVLKETSGE